MPTRRRWVIGCGAALAIAVVGPMLIRSCALAVVMDGPWLEVEPSPDGRFDVLRETHTFGLDGYTRLWIAAHGESDRARWFEIAPQVDGTWHTEWVAADHLMLTDHGAWPETRMPYRDRHWRGVRIETRVAARPVSCLAADAMHEVTVWTQEDSRGCRSTVVLSSTWQSGDKLWERVLPYGPWQVEATWLAVDHLHLSMRAEPGVSLPQVASSCGRITITSEWSGQPNAPGMHLDPLTVLFEGRPVAILFDLLESGRAEQRRDAAVQMRFVYRGLPRSPLRTERPGGDEAESEPCRQRAGVLLPHLIPLLEDRDPTVRFAVVETIRDMGHHAESARSALEALRDDGYPEVREAVRQALAALPE